MRELWVMFISNGCVCIMLFFKVLEENPNTGGCLLEISKSLPYTGKLPLNLLFKYFLIVEKQTVKFSATKTYKLTLRKSREHKMFQLKFESMLLTLFRKQNCFIRHHGELLLYSSYLSV